MSVQMKRETSGTAQTGATPSPLKMSAGLPVEQPVELPEDASADLSTKQPPEASKLPKFSKVPRLCIEQLEEALEERQCVDRRVNSTTKLPEGMEERRKGPRRKSD